MYKFTDDVIDGFLHDGFEIAVVGDMRWVFRGKYKAYLYSTNEVLVQLPSMDWAFLNERDDVQVAIERSRCGSASH